MERIIEPDEIILTVDNRRLTEEEEQALHEAIAQSKQKQQFVEIESPDTQRHDMAPPA